MFHHLLQTNNLRPKFEEFGLIWEEDIPFIEELITGNPNKACLLFYLSIDSMYYRVEIQKKGFFMR